MNESKIPGNKWFEFWCGTYRIGTWGKTRKKALMNCSCYKIMPFPTSYNERVKAMTSAIIFI